MGVKCILRNKKQGSNSNLLTERISDSENSDFFLTILPRIGIRIVTSKELEINFIRLSHDEVTCDVDRDVSTAILQIFIRR